MTKELKNQYFIIKDIVEEHYLPVVQALLDEQIIFLQSFKAQYGPLGKLGTQHDLEAEYKLIKKYKSTLIDLLRSSFQRPTTCEFDDVFSDFNNALSEYILTLERERILVQRDERFRPQHDDVITIRVAKGLKLALFKISRTPQKLLNGFRKLLNKPQRTIVNWEHRIHFRNIACFYLKEELSSQLLNQLDDVYAKICATSKIAWQLDESFDHALDNFADNGSVVDYDSIVADLIADNIQKLENLKKTIAHQALYHLDDVYAKYEFNFDLAGTIELSNSRFSGRKIAKKHKRINSLCESSLTNWHNTLLLLTEDWNIDVELYKIIYAVREKYHQILKKLNVKIDHCLSKNLAPVKDYFISCQENVDKGKPKQLRASIEKELDSLSSRKYFALLDRANDAVLDEDFPNLIDQLEATVNTLVAKVSEKRAVVRGSAYEKPIKSSAISYISPKELINFEPLPIFEKVTKKAKLQISEGINNAQLQIADLHQIAKFNLESGLTLFDDDDAIDDPKEIVLEGISRTIDKVEKVGSYFEQFDQLFQADLVQGLDRFSNSLIKLTSNENIFEIRIRIAKGKAILRSKQIKEKLLDTGRNFFPKVIRLVRLKYQNLRTWVNETFKKYGLSSAAINISTELADFLAETAQAVDRLPFVYRRLFKSTPLTDKSLFEGRKDEIRILNNAYNNWMRERFAATMIIGEKGSGVTSLINIYLNDLSSSCEIIRFSPPKALHTTDELVGMMSEQLGTSFEDMNDLIGYLMKGNKKIMVIENMQLLFLKKVGGFKCLHQLTELISLTYKNVFWVMSCTAYTWDYLDKAMGLNDHFSYIIKMNDFDNKTIVDIVTRRHKISGYDVHFEPSGEELNSKKFKKLKEAEQQNLLRDEFFDGLNKIARSNVSLGLMYWMRSTKEVSGNTLAIGSLKDIDFSFMKNLSVPKVYALTELLLHDGLTEKEFCEISNLSLSKSRSVLNPLKEDGIITFEEEVYRINPLLYRQTINLLKTKNVIH